MQLRPPAPLWPVLLVASTAFAAALWVDLEVGQHHVDRREVTVVAVNTSLSDGEGGAAPPGPDLSPQHRQARTWARRGDLVQALPAFAQVLKSNPENGRVRGEYAYWLLSADRTEEALTFLDRAALEAPGNAWVAFTLGRAFQQGGDLHGAEAAYRQALGIRPAYQTARISLAVVLRKQGKVDASIAILEQDAHVAGRGDVARTQVVLGRSHLAVGRIDRAAAAFEQALEHAPADVNIRMGIANAWSREGDHPELGRAVAVLEQTVRLAPDVARIRSALGRALERSEQLSRAIEAYRAALDLDPDYAYVRQRLARISLNAGDLPTARVHAMALLSSAAHDPEHHLLAALVAAAEGANDRAREHYRDAISTAGGAYPEASFNLGVLERRAGKLKAAEAAYRRALAHRPDYPEASNNLALTLLDAGRSREAEATWRTLVALHPDYLSAWINLGSLLSSSDRPNEAIACYQRSLEIRPAYPKAWLNLGVAQSKAGLSAGAMETYRALVATHPLYAAGWYNLGLLSKRVGDIEAARAALIHALDADERHVGARRSLASLEKRAGRLTQALSLYEELLDLEPNDADARLAYAATLGDAGRLRECAEQADAALALAPGLAGAARTSAACRGEVIQ